MALGIEGGEAGVVSGTTAEWLCSYQPDVPTQKLDWCVPGCMAILSLRLFGQQRDAAWFASQWKQPADETVDTYFPAFKNFCTSNGLEMLVDYSNYGVPKPWCWMTGLGRPTLIATDSHAMVCIGTCSHMTFAQAACKGYRVLDPADPTRPDDWKTFPDPDLIVRFAFRVKAGPDCPRDVPLNAALGLVVR